MAGATNTAAVTGKLSADIGDKSYSGSLTILTSLFFMWGFITCLNDILIPHLKSVFTLNYTQAMLIQFCFFTAYFIVSIPSGYLVEKIGYKTGIIIGLATAGIGCLLFYPAAGSHSYPLFLGAFFVLASGITLLQVAANPYVAILGKPETASSRLNLTQAFNSLGTTIAPYLGAMFILSTAIKTADEISLLNPEDLSAYQAAEAAAVQNPYLLLAAVLFLIAIVFAVIKLPKVEASEQKSSDGSSTSLDHVHDSAWGYKHLVLGAIGIFVYVGGEVSIGSFLVNFLHDPSIAGLTEVDAGKYVSMYWGGAMIGRFLGSVTLSDVKNAMTRNISIAAVFLLAVVLVYLNTGNWGDSLKWLVFVVINIGAFLIGKHNPGKTLFILSIGAALLVIITMVSPGNIAMWTILSVGLFNSVMFPTIFTLALDGLGKHTGQGSGILCAAIVGGALLPVAQGFFADQIGIQHAFFIPVLCYLYIAFYGYKGYKIELAK